MWKRIIELVESHHGFQVSTHIHPDGDAIGSQIGLALFLEALGKKAFLVNQDPVPRIYRFLDPEGRVREYEPARDDAEIAACDAAVVIDVGALDRVGRVGEAIRRHRVPTVCIDHHVTNDGFAEINVVEPDVASSSSLVLDLIRTMGRKPSERIAEALFVGLSTDTGWFRFSNAKPPAFRDAADLVECGADPVRLYELVYENLSWPRTRLLAKTLSTLQSDADGRIAYITITRAMFDETGATEDEVEGYVDYLRTIGGVEVIVMFRERAEGGTRVSLRSKHDADVGSLAARFGGGGHRRAAGIVLDQPMEAVIPQILAAARRLVKE